MDADFRPRSDGCIEEDLSRKFSLLNVELQSVDRYGDLTDCMKTRLRPFGQSSARVVTNSGENRSKRLFASKTSYMSKLRQKGYFD